jgi:hypothetical protein
MVALARRYVRLYPALFAVAFAVALPPAASAASSPYSTKVIVSLKFPAFHGTVTAGKSSCTKDRTVKLLRKRRAADKLLGTDKSNAKAQWSIPIGKKLPSGSYYAKTPAKGRCRAARSKVLTIP